MNDGFVIVAVILFYFKLLAKVHVPCDGRKSFKVLTSCVVFSLKAIVLHLHFHIFIALALMLQNIYKNNFDSIFST